MAAIDLLVFLLHAAAVERGVLLLMHKVAANKIFESRLNLKVHQCNHIGSPGLFLLHPPSPPPLFFSLIYIGDKHLQTLTPEFLGVHHLETRYLEKCGFHFPALG